MARNRKLQRQYWELFRGSQWANYRVVAPAKGVDSILECDLAQDPDLQEPEVLTKKIELTTAAFIRDVEKYLAKHPLLSAGHSR